MLYIKMKKKLKIWDVWINLLVFMFFVSCWVVVYAVTSSWFFDNYKVASLEGWALSSENWNSLMNDLNNEVVPAWVIFAFAWDSCPWEWWLEADGLFSSSLYEQLSGNYNITYCIKKDSSMSYNCLPGYYYNESESICKRCNNWEWSDGHMSECLHCVGPIYSEWTSNWTSENNCDWQCGDGYYQDGDICKECENWYCIGWVIHPCPEEHPRNGARGQSTFVGACWGTVTIYAEFNTNASRNILGGKFITQYWDYEFPSENIYRTDDGLWATVQVDWVPEIVMEDSYIEGFSLNVGNIWKNCSNSMTLKYQNSYGYIYYEWWPQDPNSWTQPWLWNC